jgi:hypothetical protein
MTLPSAVTSRGTGGGLGGFGVAAGRANMSAAATEVARELAMPPTPEKYHASPSSAGGVGSDKVPTEPRTHS